MMRAWFLVVPAVVLLAACSGAGGGTSDVTDAVLDADISPADAADAVGKDAPEATEIVDATDVDVPPAPAWTITTEAADPTTDAWVRLTPVATDPVAGTVTVAIEVSPFASLLGLSFHLGLDPTRAEIVGLSRVFEPTASGSTAWGLLARSGASDVQGGLAIMRTGESGFGGGSALSGSLSQATVLYNVQAKLLAPGTLALTLDFPDTVAVAPDWTALPLERVGLTVTATQEVGQ